MGLFFFPVGSPTAPETPVGTIATIPAGVTSSRYRRIALWPTPSAAITYTVDYERDVTDMVNAKDEPMLPRRFHRLIAVGARAKEYEKKDDPARHRAVSQEFSRGMSDLRYFAASGLDVRPVMGGRRMERPSQLGAYFPSGS